MYLGIYRHTPTTTVEETEDKNMKTSKEGWYKGGYGGRKGRIK